MNAAAVVADLIEFTLSVPPASSPAGSVDGPLAGSPGSVPHRPGELPAPGLLQVRSEDLEAGDVVAIGDRWLAVEVVLDRRSIDGLLRVVLADGSRFTASASGLWEVHRG